MGMVREFVSQKHQYKQKRLCATVDAFMHTVGMPVYSYFDEYSVFPPGRFAEFGSF